MEKRIKFIGIFIFFLLFIFSSVIFGQGENEKLLLQETVKTELTVRGTMVKQRYIIRFSTEEKKDNETVISGSPEITPGSEEAEIPPGSDETVQKRDTGESDEFSGFHRLIEAEKRFKDDMEKVT